MQTLGIFKQFAWVDQTKGYLPPWRNRSPSRFRVHAKKQAWVQTENQEVFTAAVEAGIDTVMFSDKQTSIVQNWKNLASFKPLFCQGNSIEDEEGSLIGVVEKLEDGSDLKAVQSRAKHSSGILLMDATDWQIIKAENLVAAFQDSSCEVFAAVPTSSDAQTMLEALETGTDGVLLRTEDPKEVRKLGGYLLRSKSSATYEFEVGRISKVEALGMGHRVCVDLCEEMQSGEGMLVGSFSRGLFLVHSECSESQYINTRPFRVNAGPVHAYVQGLEGRTEYLSELKSGSSVLVANAEGHCRTAIVGRVKQEVRPMVLVEAELPSGDTVSTILQNAETVQLVGPADSGSQSWDTVTVPDATAGDAVYILCQGGARHTGISIEEQIIEK